LSGKAGQSEIIESLLMYSADVHRMSRAGETALHGLFLFLFFFFVVLCRRASHVRAGETALLGLFFFSFSIMFIYT
jgi:hypothetical protein